eukprot:342970-Amphidinium_carterae.1
MSLIKEGNEGSAARIHQRRRSKAQAFYCLASGRACQLSHAEQSASSQGPELENELQERAFSSSLQLSTETQHFVDADNNCWLDVEDAEVSERKVER